MIGAVIDVLNNNGADLTVGAVCDSVSLRFAASCYSTIGFMVGLQTPTRPQKRGLQAVRSEGRRLRAVPEPGRRLRRAGEFANLEQGSETPPSGL